MFKYMIASKSRFLSMFIQCCKGINAAIFPFYNRKYNFVDQEKVLAKRAITSQLW